MTTDAQTFHNLNDGVEDVAIDAIKPHPDNPNKGAEGALEKSIDQLGFYGAVVAQRSTGFIVAGNHRWAIARRAGAEQIPVIWIDVDDEKALAILLADNRINRLGVDDTELLANALQQIQQSPYAEASGYSQTDIAQIVDSVTPKRDEFLDGEGSQRDPGNPVVQYQIIFNTEEEQQTFYRFVRWLKRTHPGDTVSERLTAFIDTVLEGYEEE